MSYAAKQEANVCIPQGSNNPLVIEFDEVIEGLTFTISLWSTATGYTRKPLKVWTAGDIVIQGKLAICQLTEQETSDFPTTGSTTLEIKARGDDGYTVFWEGIPIRVEKRKDKDVKMAGGG